MAIIERNIRRNLDKLVERHSDKGVYIRQVETGIEYDKAIDKEPCPYTYVETDKPIER